MVREVLYGSAVGRTTAVLAESLDRLLEPKHGSVLVFVGNGPSTMIPHWKQCARSVAEALDIPVLDEKRDALFVGSASRELRFVTARQFMHGVEMRGRDWGGSKYPSFVADPAVLEQLWKLRTQKF